LTPEKVVGNLPWVNNMLAKNLSVLVLSLLLSLPGLVFADHSHGTTTEDLNCELCGHIGAASPDENTNVAIAISGPQKIEGKAFFAPLKIQLLRPRQRAPPPLP